MQNTETRPWEWTPPPSMNRMMAIMLRIPVVRRPMSKMILLLTYSGRKSGKTYTFPIGYWRQGDTVILLTKRFRSWWHNFQQPTPVTIRIGGQTYTGRAQASTDETVIVPRLVTLMEGQLRQAQVWHVHLDPEGKPNLEDIRTVAPKIVMIQVDLSH